LFSDATGGIGESVDLDLAAGDSPALDLAFDDQADAAMDLDLGEGDDTASVTLELGTPDDTADSLDLDIGSQTAAGLEAAFFERTARQDESAKTSPNLDLDDAAATLESPTIDAIGPDAPTIESPMIEDTVSASVDLPTLRQPGLGGQSDQTAEIDLDDLGLDVSELSSLADDLTGESPSLLDLDDDDADVLSATGVTQVLSVGDRADDSQSDDDEIAYTSTEVLQPRGSDDAASTARYPNLDAGAAGDDDFGLDLDLDELSAALDGGDTAEQPSIGGFGGNNGLDLDVGFDSVGNDDPTATEQMPPLDAQTLTEVGTKLDLARAYIDMGDPDGARSILREVLDEGDKTQQAEARGLIDALGA